MEFDGYRLEEKLHTGGMAALWHVTDLRQRHVANRAGKWCAATDHESTAAAFF
jgi:hypothetical protein